MSTLFIIDIGSNSVRLAKIVNGITVYKQKENTRLAKGLSVGGILQSAATSLTLNVVEKFVNIAREEGHEPRIFATAAVRNANNGSEFVATVKRTFAISIDVISGETEAYLGFLGVYPAAESIYGKEVKEFCVIDIGGASTEVISGSIDAIKYSKSMDVGIVALKEASVKACGAHITLQCIDNAIERLIKSDAIDSDLICKDSVFAIGGTAACIAAIDLGLEVYDLTKVHCHRITKQRLDEISNMLLNLTVEEIKGIAGVEEGRADVIQGGVRLLQKILEMIGADEFVVSESDNIEGYAKHKKLI